MNFKQQFIELEKNLSKFWAGELHPDSIYDIEDVIKITGAKNILEIGFRRGVSASQWLLASEANLTSIDVYVNEKSHADCTQSINYLKDRFKDRFEFIQMNSNDIPKKEDWKNKFDLVFIDGGHNPSQVMIDTQNAINHIQADHIFYDDYFTGTGPGVKHAIKTNNLKIIKIYEPRPDGVWISGKTGGGHCLVEVI